MTHHPLSNTLKEGIEVHMNSRCQLLLISKRQPLIGLMVDAWKSRVANGLKISENSSKTLALRND